jgi:putative ABC transport system permease protein
VTTARTLDFPTPLAPVTRSNTPATIANDHRARAVACAKQRNRPVDRGLCCRSRVVGPLLRLAEQQRPCVLGAQAAQLLGIDRVFAGERIWLDGMWFYIAGILRSAVLAPEIDSSVLVGFPAAERYLDFDGHPSEIYVRAQTSQVDAVYNVLAATADPQAPSNVDVSQPSEALVARADAQGASNDLFLGLAAVALLVGAVGVANIMIIGVLERRSEIGLRRALGATKANIRHQFLSEAIVLALLGGVVGVLAGIFATAIYASAKGWVVVIPPLAWGGGLAAAIAIGAVAGLLPAIRAARMAPTDALRTICARQKQRLSRFDTTAPRARLQRHQLAAPPNA